MFFNKSLLFHIMSISLVGILLNLTDVELSQHFDGIVQMTANVLSMDCWSLIQAVTDKMKNAEKVRII